ncbi:intracellular septation protein A [Caulobacter ginsengisoli]|uniref:Intracellular septation protein A n=1 Tax=Caulobacter ginsengisoli TaxID=400775 RepID=A0ABU0INU0_9CAUL|nr:septation protein IspZ [Caulobacter ginsengisoli]MDQ0463624.1 intracellular septation protein A [Caulobacter ginsengisoli]
MNPFMQAVRPLAADMLSTFVFVGLRLAGVDLRLAVGLGIAIAVAQIGWALYAKKPIGALQWMSLGLITVLGGVSILTDDPRFVMVKPSIIYIVVGTVMLQPYWMRRYMPDIAKGRLGERPLLIAGYVWAALMFATAAINAYVAMSYSLTTWALFMAIFPMASKAALFLGQYGVFRTLVIRKVRAERLAAQPA